MEILPKGYEPPVNPDKIKIEIFLKIHLKTRGMTFDVLRYRLNITISDQALCQICAENGYGVIK